MNLHRTRREFLKRSALAGASFWLARSKATAQSRSPNDKLNIGIIGVHSRGAANMASVATQMGTQIHASDNYRRVVELIQSGAIGPVREAHAWVEQGIEGPRSRPQEEMSVPKNLNWDLWLGPAPLRPYHSGALIEHNLLGTVAFRTGQKLDWDPEKLKATHCPEADRFIRRSYREGWTLF